MRSLNRIEVEGIPVRREQELDLDGIILPGGESNTIGKLMDIFGMMNPLRERILGGMPVWGTCAGMILLAREIAGEKPQLGLMDITVRRNAYGRQLDSFTADTLVTEVSDHPVPLVFIRAPWVEAVGPSVQVLCELNGHIVAVRQQQMLATSFHPELTQDDAFHRYFVKMCD